MIELTAEQRQALMSGEMVRIPAAEMGKNVVLLLEEQFQKFLDMLEEEQEDRKVQEGWQKLAYRGITLSLDEGP